MSSVGVAVKMAPDNPTRGGEKTMSQSRPMPNLKAVPRLDLAVLGGGVLTFIFSFLPWYGSSGVTIGGRHFGGASVTAWHSYSTLALLLSLVGLALAAITIFSLASMPTLPVGPRWITAGLFSLAALLELIRILTLHHGDGVGVRWGGYLLLIVMLATAAASVMAALGSGEDVPWQARTATAPPAEPPTV